MKNHTEFNLQASDYVKYRPTYPKEIYEFLTKECPSLETAYDIGTGSGQCAVDLADYFKTVFASDLSVEQVSKAILKKNINYFVSEAHESNFADQTIDLITVATAIHWFNFDLFYKECKRILKPNGILAAWSYGWHRCENQEINEFIDFFGKEVLKEYWSEPPKLIWNEYKTIPFPFSEIEPHQFVQKTKWSLDELVGYMTTWSATQKYIQKNGKHPIEDHLKKLNNLWGDQSRKIDFYAPLIFRVGRHVI